MIQTDLESLILIQLTPKERILYDETIRPFALSLTVFNATMAKSRFVRFRSLEMFKGDMYSCQMESQPRMSGA